MYVCGGGGGVVFFFKQKTAYEIGVRLVGSEMCIRDRKKRICAMALTLALAAGGLSLASDLT